jgi:hypothetical protein
MKSVFVGCTLMGGICGDTSFKTLSMAFFVVGGFFGIIAFFQHLDS